MNINIQRKPIKVIPIEDVRKVEQEILDEFHRVCIKYNLKYSLSYGTLLGAIRHGGFIPWDDDIDVMMPRNDYERFIKIWDDIDHEGFNLVNYRINTDSVNNFIKLKKNHTTFLVKEDIDRSYHKGIYIDIFPVDRVAPGFFRRNFQYVCSAINLLYSRNYRSGNKGLIGLIEIILLKVNIKYHVPIKKTTEIIIRKWNKNENLLNFMPVTIGDAKRYFEANLFQDLKLIEFNGKEYLSINNTDSFLKTIYGNYMELPPIEERIWKHSALILDTDKDFDELPDYILKKVYDMNN